MSIMLPDWAAGIIGVLGGGTWPEADEDALFALGAAWKQAAGDLKALDTDLADAKSAVDVAYPEGKGHDAIVAALDQFVTGNSSFDTLSGFMDQLGDYSDGTGASIEHSKLQILVAAAVTVAMLASAAIPGCQADLPLAWAMLRMALIGILQELFIELIQLHEGHIKSLDGWEIAFSGANMAASELGGRLFGKGFGSLLEKMLAGPIGKAVGEDLLKSFGQKALIGIAGGTGGLVAATVAGEAESTIMRGLTTGDWHLDKPEFSTNMFLNLAVSTGLHSALPEHAPGVTADTTTAPDVPTVTPDVPVPDTGTALTDAITTDSASPNGIPARTDQPETISTNESPATTTQIAEPPSATDNSSAPTATEQSGGSTATPANDSGPVIGRSESQFPTVDSDANQNTPPEQAAAEPRTGTVKTAAPGPVRSSPVTSRPVTSDTAPVSDEIPGQPAQPAASIAGNSASEIPAPMSDSPISAAPTNETATPIPGPATADETATPVPASATTAGVLPDASITGARGSGASDPQTDLEPLPVANRSTAVPEPSTPALDPVAADMISGIDQPTGNGTESQGAAAPAAPQKTQDTGKSQVPASDRVPASKEGTRNGRTETVGSKSPNERTTRAVVSADDRGAPRAVDAKPQSEIQARAGTEIEANPADKSFRIGSPVESDDPSHQDLSATPPENPQQLPENSAEQPSDQDRAAIARARGTLATLDRYESEHPPQIASVRTDPDQRWAYEWRRYPDHPDGPLSVVRIPVDVAVDPSIEPATGDRLEAGLWEKLRSAGDSLFNRGHTLPSGDRFLAELVPATDEGSGAASLYLTENGEFGTLHEGTTVDDLAQRLHQDLGLEPGSGHGLSEDDLYKFSRAICRANTDAMLGGLEHIQRLGRYAELEDRGNQYDLEDILRMPGENRFRIGVNPEEYTRRINPGGLDAPGRRDNCVIASLSALATFYGDPTVSVPRAPTVVDGRMTYTGVGDAEWRQIGPWMDNRPWDNFDDGTRTIPEQFDALRARIENAGPGSAALVVWGWKVYDAEQNPLFNPDGTPMVTSGHAIVLVYPHDAQGPVWFDPQSGEIITDPRRLPEDVVQEAVSLEYVAFEPPGGTPDAIGTEHRGTDQSLSDTGIRNDPTLPGDPLRPLLGVPGGAVPGADRPEGTPGPGQLPGGQANRGGHDDSQLDAPTPGGEAVRRVGPDRPAPAGTADLSAPVPGDHPANAGGSEDDRIPGADRIPGPTSGTDQGIPPGDHQDQPGLPTGDTTGGERGGLGAVAGPNERNLAGTGDIRGVEPPAEGGGGPLSVASGEHGPENIGRAQPPHGDAEQPTPPPESQPDRPFSLSTTPNGHGDDVEATATRPAAVDPPGPSKPGAHPDEGAQRTSRQPDGSDGPVRPRLRPVRLRLTSLETGDSNQPPPVVNPAGGGSGGNDNGSPPIAVGDHGDDDISRQPTEPLQPNAYPNFDESAQPTHPQQPPAQEKPGETPQRPTGSDVPARSRIRPVKLVRLETGDSNQTPPVVNPAELPTRPGGTQDETANAYGQGLRPQGANPNPQGPITVDQIKPPQPGGGDEAAQMAGGQQMQQMMLPPEQSQQHAPQQPDISPNPPVREAVPKIIDPRDLVRQQVILNREQDELNFRDNRRIATEQALADERLAAQNELDRAITENRDVRNPTARVRAAQDAEQQFRNQADPDLDELRKRVADRQQAVNKALRQTGRPAAGLYDKVASAEAERRALRGQRAGVQTLLDQVKAQIDALRQHGNGADPDVAQRMKELLDQRTQLIGDKIGLDEKWVQANIAVHSLLRFGNDQSGATVDLSSARVIARFELPVSGSDRMQVNFTRQMLDEQVRNGNLSPILPEELRRPISAVRAVLNESGSTPERVRAALDAARSQIDLAARNVPDPRLTAYAHRLINELETGSSLPEQHWWQRAAWRSGVVDSQSATKTMRVGADIVEAGNGTRYLRFNRLTDMIAYEANRYYFGSGVWDGLSDVLPPVDHELLWHEHFGLGYSASANTAVVEASGRRFEQNVDQRDYFAVKINPLTPGPAFIEQHVNFWPEAESQQDPATFDPALNLHDVDKVTIKNYWGVNPRIFFNHIALADVPLTARIVMDIVFTSTDNGAPTRAVNYSLQLMASYSVLENLVQKTLPGILGANHIAVPPDWALKIPDVGGDSTISLNLNRLFGGGAGAEIPQEMRDALARAGISVDRNGNLTSPPDRFPRPPPP
ncbi:hypothetical protein ABH933_004565 [Nocardia sp. GP40]|uniref:WXG100-like domain-containing protein n=1 Tax=Nocardia sp. GP40 TaxID=3156268 RepID=UPI003D1E057D